MEKPIKFFARKIDEFIYLKNTFIDDHTKINCIFKSHLLCVSLPSIISLLIQSLWEDGATINIFHLYQCAPTTFLVGVSCCQVYQCQKSFVFIKMDSVVTECIYWKEPVMILYTFKMIIGILSVNLVMTWCLLPSRNWDYNQNFKKAQNVTKEEVTYAWVMGKTRELIKDIWIFV